MTSETTKKIAAQYAAIGLPCEIEAGARGVVIYASSRETADKIARDIAKTIAARDPGARATAALEDGDEPSETSWWSAVDFDWRRI